MLLSGEQAKEEFYKMGSLFAKPKKAKSRVTEQDKAILVRELHFNNIYNSLKIYLITFICL